jgi:hypothetical protein
MDDVLNTRCSKYTPWDGDWRMGNGANLDGRSHERIGCA